MALDGSNCTKHLIYSIYLTLRPLSSAASCRLRCAYLDQQEGQDVGGPPTEEPTGQVVQRADSDVRLVESVRAISTLTGREDEVILSEANFFDFSLSWKDHGERLVGVLISAVPTSSSAQDSRNQSSSRTF